MDKCINKLIDDQYEYSTITHTRSVARAILINDSKEVCLLHVVGIDDFGNRNYYETPGGGINNDESLEEAVLREIHEETGFHASIITYLGYVDDYYNLIKRHNITHYFLLKAESFDHEELEEYEKEIISEKVWVSFDKAINLYKNMNKEKLETLVSKRELPVLLKAIKYLED